MSEFSSQKSPSLEGAVIDVPDKIWGFYVANRMDHPGAVVRVDREVNRAVLTKGTDAKSRGVRGMKNPYVVFPDEENGLSKETVFELVPVSFRVRRVELLEKDRRRGALGRSDLVAMQAELERIFAVEEVTVNCGDALPVEEGAE